jgi:hypothetical protein
MSVYTLIQLYCYNDAEFDGHYIPNTQKFIGLYSTFEKACEYALKLKSLDFPLDIWVPRVWIYENKVDNVDNVDYINNVDINRDHIYIVNNHENCIFNNKKEIVYGNKDINSKYIEIFECAKELYKLDCESEQDKILAELHTYDTYHHVYEYVGLGKYGITHRPREKRRFTNPYYVLGRSLKELEFIKQHIEELNKKLVKDTLPIKDQFELLKSLFCRVREKYNVLIKIKKQMILEFNVIFDEYQKEKNQELLDKYNSTREKYFVLVDEIDIVEKNRNDIMRQLVDVGQEYENQENEFPL